MVLTPSSHSGDMPAGPASAAQLKTLAASILGVDESESIGVKVLVVLLASSIVGADVDRIASFSGYLREFVASLEANLRNSGIWVEQDVHHDWFGEAGEIALIADGLVARGLVARNPPPAGGLPAYGHTEAGRALAKKISDQLN